MKFTNSEMLRVLRHVVTGAIQPELESANSQTAAHVALLAIDELRKRDTTRPELLRGLIESGLSIAKDMRDVLAKPNAADVEELTGNISDLGAHQCEPNNLAGLRQKYNAVTALLEEAGTALVDLRAQSDADQDRISELLRAAAAWEYAYFEEQARPMDEAAADEAESSGELTAEKLAGFIETQVADAAEVTVDGLSRVPGGMGKETYFFSLETGVDGHALNGELVARKTPPGAPLTEGSFDIRREHALLSALKDSGLPIPKAYWLGDNIAGVDGPFYVLEKRPGQVCGTFIATADDVPEAFWLDAGEKLAKLHRLPIETFSDYLKEWDDPGLLTGTAADGTASYVRWFKSYWETFDRFASPVEIYLLDWLEREIPPNDRPPSLVHGDFGAHNILRDGDRMSAMLDWEGYMFGDPAFDLAYVRKYVSHTMSWEKFLDHYYSCGGPETDESSFIYYDTLQAARIVAFSAMNTARMHFAGSNDLKDLMLELGFLPEMIRIALESADRA